MSEEGNKELVRSFAEDVFVKRDVNAVDRYMAPNFKNRETSGSGDVKDFKGTLKYLFTVAPDGTMTVHNVAADGDTVMAYVTWSGTQEGEIRMPNRMDVAPTGKHFSTEQVHIFRIEDGKIAEHRAVRDDLGWFRQLGAI
jgi:predicted ester cyclase